MRLTSLIVALVAAPLAVLAQGAPSLQGSVTSQSALDKLGEVSVAGDGAGNWYAVDPKTNKYWTLDGAVKDAVGRTAPAPVKGDEKPAAVATKRHPRDFSPGTGTSPNDVGHLSARWWKCKLIGKPCASCHHCKKDFWEKICCWKKYFCYIPYTWSPVGPGWGHKRDALPQVPGGGNPDPNDPAGGPNPNPGPGGGNPNPGPGGGGGGGVVVGGGGGGVGPGPLPGGGCWNSICDPYGGHYQHGTCQVW
ncbi:hypothetical protein Q8F55_008927 [Vanrija albida]|uniref:WW domain-containing protein n=1 Tax=Vanrija albida TaxID=181172 RepID=A0ABR3PS57_9TREE